MLAPHLAVFVPRLSPLHESTVTAETSDAPHDNAIFLGLHAAQKKVRHGRAVTQTQMQTLFGRSLQSGFYGVARSSLVRAVDVASPDFGTRRVTDGQRQRKKDAHGVLQVRTTL